METGLELLGHCYSHGTANAARARASFLLYLRNISL